MTKITYYPSTNFNERMPEGTGPVKIDILVIHYTGMIPENSALDWLCNPESNVSAHYLIDEKGIIIAKDLKGPALYATIKRLTK